MTGGGGFEVKLDELSWLWRKGCNQADQSPRFNIPVNTSQQ